MKLLLYFHLNDSLLHVQEIIDQSDAVLEALAEAGAELDIQHLNWDHASIASNLLKLRNETNVPKSNYSGVSEVLRCIA